MSEIGAFINGLTEDTTPDTANDLLMEYDASTGSVKKVKMTNVAGAAGVARSGSTTDEHLAVWNGSNADSIKDGGVVPSGYPDYICIVDQKAAGTNGGSAAAGAFQTRVLNTVRVNVGSHASLASNQITLSAGTYDVRASAPALEVNNHVIKLRDITNTADLLIGTHEYGQTTVNAQQRSWLAGRITLTGSTVLELQHYTGSAKADVGLGVGDDIGVVNIYSMIEFWKVA